MARTALPVSFRLDTHLKAEFSKMCRRFGWSNSLVINAMVKRFLDCTDADRLHIVAEATSFLNSPVPGTASPASGRPGSGSNGSEESPVGCPAGNGQPSP